MSLRYDAIIIGSGLGGLSAAAALAKRGLKVRLLEKHTQPGGYATTFFRGRFEFDVSLHALSGIGTSADPGPLYHQLTMLDVARRVKFIPMDTLYRAFAPGMTLTVHKGADRFVDTLSRKFPHQARGIKNLVNQVLTVGYEVDRLRDGGYSTRPLPTLLRFPNLVHAAGVPLSTMLDRELTDPLAKLAFAQIWSYFGLPPSRLSFLMFAVGLNMHLLFGSAGIAGKSQSLSNAFVEVIREAGGEVTFSNGATRIDVEGGRVKGVLTERGEQLEGDTVVSNASPVTTLSQLIDARALPTGATDKIAAAPPSVGSVNVFMGLSKPSRALGLDEFEVYLNRFVDVEKQYATCRGLVDPGCLTVCAYDLIDDTAAPEGAGIMTVTALSEGRVWTGLAPSQYTDAKNRMVEQIVNRVADRYPAVRDAVETLSISTPITNMRYTGNPSGAIYGFANTPAMNPGFRPSIKGPIEGLWFAGAWTQPGGGFQATISSGINAADAVVAALPQERRGPVTAAAAPRKLFPAPPGAKWRKLRGLHRVVQDGRTVKTTLAANFRKSGSRKRLPSSAPHETVARFHADRLPTVVLRRIVETTDTVTLRLSPKSGTIPPFHAGQYISVHVTLGGRRTTRPYSISSPPSENRFIDITVKRQRKGAVSRHLVDAVEVGDILEITGPLGEFHHTPLRDEPHLVAVAAGSGITPMMSIIEELCVRRPSVRVTLFHAARTISDRIFGARLNHLADTKPWLTVVPILSRPPKNWRGLKGRLSAALIRRHLPDRSVADRSFFICVPRRLSEQLVADLAAMGVEQRRIQVEAFGPPADITAAPDWPKGIERNDTFEVRLQGMKRILRAPAGVPLLHTLEGAGVPTTALCRTGVCDSCKLSLVEGEVFTPIDGPQPQAEGGSICIRPCMSFPVSNIALID